MGDRSWETEVGRQKLGEMEIVRKKLGDGSWETEVGRNGSWEKEVGRNGSWEKWKWEGLFRCACRWADAPGAVASGGAALVCMPLGRCTRSSRLGGALAIGRRPLGRSYADSGSVRPLPGQSVPTDDRPTVIRITGSSRHRAWAGEGLLRCACRWADAPGAVASGGAALVCMPLGRCTRSGRLGRGCSGVHAIGQMHPGQSPRGCACHRAAAPDQDY